MSPPKTAVELYKEIEDFAELELREQKAHIRAQLAKPLTDRLRAGRCVSNLRYVGRNTNGSYRFHCSENLSDLREDDIVLVHTGQPLESGYVMTWVDDGLMLAGQDYMDLASNGSSQPVWDSSTGYTVDAYYLDLSATIRSAIQQLGSTERGRERILPLFMGKLQDDVDFEEYENAVTMARKQGFNDRQQEAVAGGVACHWCHLIQGPPGTGKTRVLAQIVKQRIQRGERVLVSACTHRAIHEALNAVKNAMPEFDAVVKISQHTCDPSLRVPVYESFTESPLCEMQAGYVVGATPFAAHNRRLEGVEFDCVIIDEASQMTLPMAIMAMLTADTYIIIGDPKQLPPVVVSSSPFEAINHSLFKRLTLQRDRIQLNITYRMNAALSNWVSESFYYGDLQASLQSKDRRLQLSRTPQAVWMAEVLNPNHSIVWIPTSTIHTRHYSMEEADLVHQLVCELFSQGFDLRQLAVITPFRRQGRMIRRRLLQSKILKNDAIGGMVIDTVERMQGQERQLIIISTAASDVGFLTAIREFIYLPQRLNVAVSRAQSKCIILGSDTFIDSKRFCHDPVIADAVKLWKDLKNRSRVVEV